MPSADQDAKEIARKVNTPEEAAKLQQGLIVSIETGTCTVRLGSASSDTPGFRYLADAYSPIAGDVVWVLDGGPGSKFIIGTTGSRHGDWVNMAYAAGASTSTVYNAGHVGAYRLKDGMLQFKGHVKSTAGAVTWDLTTLPVGRRPAKNEWALVFASGGVAALLANTTGVIQLAPIGATRPDLFAALDGIQVPL